MCQARLASVSGLKTDLVKRMKDIVDDERGRDLLNPSSGLAGQGCLSVPFSDFHLVTFKAPNLQALSDGSTYVRRLWLWTWSE
mmetsp:Transcript_4114/g.9102  ORF Transcript_4114/g.9102 Transcript_4114/m.9102 type:complete len:83 (+) Transcript_4114:360-608(+)